MNTKLSIIIPVYNGERYIEACLNSLVKQALNDVEIIVINDGATDSTDNIITTTFKTYIENGSLIYLPTQNGGVSAARNIGLDNAVGEYIAFVDADDLVSADYVQTILTATAESPSIIEFGYRSIDQHGNVIKDNCYVHTQFGKHAASKILNTVFAACTWYPVLRVIRRELFNKIRYPVGVRFCEDLMTLSAIYKNASHIYTLSNVLYEYRINQSGATMNIRPDYATHLIDYYRQIAHEQTFANKALKVNLAYAIRRCVAETTDPLGKMPMDIEADIHALVFTPSLFFKIRTRLVIYAIWGSALFRAKLLVKNFTKQKI